MGGICSTYGILVKNLMGRDHVGGLRADNKIILNWVLETIRRGQAGCNSGYWSFVLFKSREVVAHRCSNEVQRIYKLPYNLHRSYTTFPYP
jgi:hypothetical protein